MAEVKLEDILDKNGSLSVGKSSQLRAFNPLEAVNATLRGAYVILLPFRGHTEEKRGYNFL